MDTVTPVKYEHRDGVVVATIRTTHIETGQAVKELVWALEDHVDTCPGIHLLIDFHRVSRISSDFLSELTALRRSVEGNGGTLRLCALRPRVREVLGAFDLKGLYLGYETEHALTKYQIYLWWENARPHLPSLHPHTANH